MHPPGLGADLPAARLGLHALLRFDIRDWKLHRSVSHQDSNNTGRICLLVYRQ